MRILIAYMYYRGDDQYLVAKVGGGIRHPAVPIVVILGMARWLNRPMVRLKQLTGKVPLVMKSYPAFLTCSSIQVFQSMDALGATKVDLMMSAVTQTERVVRSQYNASSAA